MEAKIASNLKISCPSQISKIFPYVVEGNHTFTSQGMSIPVAVYRRSVKVRNAQIKTNKIFIYI